MGRRVTSIRVDEDVFREAKELGLNISKVSENALREAVRKLKGENCRSIRNSRSISSMKKAGPPGFEPGTSGSGGRRPIQARPRAPLYLVP